MFTSRFHKNVWSWKFGLSSWTPIGQRVYEPGNILMINIKSWCVLPSQKALRTGTSTRLDERVFAMCEFKTQPLQQLMRMVHPDLYRLDDMSDQVGRRTGGGDLWNSMSWRRLAAILTFRESLSQLVSHRVRLACRGRCIWTTPWFPSLTCSTCRLSGWPGTERSSWTAAT